MKQEPKKEELIEHILQLGEKAFRELIPILPTEWLQLDLTMPQLKVVLLLFLNGPARMSDIASALDVSLATATGVVDRLVERDIVVRESQPEDRRVVLCRLSEKGQKMIGGYGMDKYGTPLFFEARGNCSLMGCSSAECATPTNASCTAA